MFTNINIKHIFPNKYKHKSRPHEDYLVLSSETIAELGQEQGVVVRLRVVRELQGQVGRVQEQKEQEKQLEKQLGERWGVSY